MVKILIMSGKMTPLGLFEERSFWHHIFFIWRHQKVYGMNQILLGMLSCEQSLLTIEKFGHSIITSIVWGFEQNNTLFERWFWFSFSNLGLALRMTLKLYNRLATLNFLNSVAKGVKLKVRKFWELTPTFAEFTVKKLGRVVLPFHPFWI